MRDVKPRVQPALQPVPDRLRNFDEMIQGYALEDALEEARRCILCKSARCQGACPLGNRIPQWIAELQQGRFEEAYRIIREISPMPELCSRLCPQERLCEGACALGIKHEPVAIGLLERFVCDQNRARPNGVDPTPATAPMTGSKRVAAIGSGPASLAFAQAMARAGHRVTVFERWPKLGGVLRWIPRFKLPSELLDAHLAMLTRMGVTFYTNTEVSWIESLLTDEDFEGVFIGIGASRPSMPQLPGESLKGICSSTEFLVRTFYSREELPNDWEPIADVIGRRVVVLGGGDSAMDCVRTALRLNAAEVTCAYRRDEANMPGSKKEVRAAKEEGANLQWLTAPVAFHSDDGRSVSQVECLRMELGPPDASGRRSPKPILNSAFRMEADLVVLAFGYEVESVFDNEHFFLMAPPKGTVRANPNTGATALRGVFAGGDCVTGPNLVCTAARAGLTAAQHMLRYFAGEPWDVLTAAPVVGSQA
ncbi:MAG: NAD(P)-dependent oxidoreductase [Candidatus Omnitrophica bacterium]|nr:NAD(P)-dependent oxidoreductase [Candidatus Omnitrophota bacterium]